LELVAEIDRIVYFLHGLTRNEVAIIRESVEKRPPSRQVGDDEAVMIN
jgi:hypothetical protein